MLSVRGRLLVNDGCSFTLIDRSWFKSRSGASRTSSTVSDRAELLPVAGSGKDCVSIAGIVPLSSDPVQSPAHSLVPLTVPTSLQLIGSFGFTWASVLLPTLGAFCAYAFAENADHSDNEQNLIVVSLHLMKAKKSSIMK